MELPIPATRKASCLPRGNHFRQSNADRNVLVLDEEGINTARRRSRDTRPGRSECHLITRWLQPG